jgi:hypothetical protein
MLSTGSLQAHTLIEIANAQVMAFAFVLVAPNPQTAFANHLKVKARAISMHAVPQLRQLGSGQSIYFFQEGYSCRG